MINDNRCVGEVGGKARDFRQVVRECKDFGCQAVRCEAGETAVEGLAGAKFPGRHRNAQLEALIPEKMSAQSAQSDVAGLHVHLDCIRHRGAANEVAVRRSPPPPLDRPPRPWPSQCCGKGGLAHGAQMCRPIGAPSGQRFYIDGGGDGMLARDISLQFSHSVGRIKLRKDMMMRMEDRLLWVDRRLCRPVEPRRIATLAGVPSAMQ